VAASFGRSPCHYIVERGQACLSGRAPNALASTSAVRSATSVASNGLLEGPWAQSIEHSQQRRACSHSFRSEHARKLIKTGSARPEPCARRGEPNPSFRSSQFSPATDPLVASHSAGAASMAALLSARTGPRDPIAIALTSAAPPIDQKTASGPPVACCSSPMTQAPRIAPTRPTPSSILTPLARYLVS